MMVLPPSGKPIRKSSSRSRADTTPAVVAANNLYVQPVTSRTPPVATSLAAAGQLLGVRSSRPRGDIRAFFALDTTPQPSHANTGASAAGSCGGGDGSGGRPDATATPAELSAARSTDSLLLADMVNTRCELAVCMCRTLRVCVLLLVPSCLRDTYPTVSHMQYTIMGTISSHQNHC
jgi:hypothetical protein